MSARRSAGGSKAGKKRGAEKRSIDSASTAAISGASAWTDIVVGVVRDGESVLVTRRPVGAHLGGFDEFPGGKREQDEALDAACVREVNEETGVMVVVEKLLAVAWHESDGKHLALTFFQCRCAGAKEPSDAARKDHHARWVNRSELAAMNFPPANTSVVQQLMAPAEELP
ncbi:MAG: (deoxy)nucleoside triphosphate pyrophosphohydrolase [Planctomycetes bacterium]|nr:(deoxy)nucleoside triphosphate pyrophosphohydrolase [Planctomycetota bacterium]